MIHVGIDLRSEFAPVHHTFINLLIIYGVAEEHLREKYYAEFMRDGVWAKALPNGDELRIRRMGGDPMSAELRIAHIPHGGRA